MAAFAVLASHLRGFVLVDWSNASERNILDAAFYLITGFGHQAVVVFFVMSGFLVGGNVVRSWSRGRWSWQIYASRRLSRLWIVLIPALFLTFAFDSVGRAMTGGSGYDGAYRALLASGPRPGGMASFDLTTALGNLFFLQMIEVPTYGTNGPLWSLSFEFWYYVAFPLAWAALRSRGVARALYAAAGVAVVWWLPRGILEGGLVWLLGVAAWYVADRFTPGGKTALLWLSASVMALVACLAGVKLGNWLGSDYALGLAVASLLPPLIAFDFRAPRYRRVAAMAADLSYTVYLVHFPVMAFAWFVTAAPQRMQPTWSGYAVFAAAFAAVSLYSLGAWWCFERHTPALQQYLEKRFQRARATEATGEPA